MHRTEAEMRVVGAHECIAESRTQTHIENLVLTALSFALSLSLSHTHTHTRTGSKVASMPGEKKSGWSLMAMSARIVTILYGCGSSSEWSEQSVVEMETAMVCFEEYTHMYTAHKCTHTHTHTDNTCAHTYIHTHACTHTHTHTHTHTPLRQREKWRWRASMGLRRKDAMR
jgi:cytochrome c biogenesis factor